MQARSCSLKWNNLLLPSLSWKEAQFEYSLDSNTTEEGLILASGVPAGSRQAASIASLTLGSQVHRSQFHLSLGLLGWSASNSSSAANQPVTLDQVKALATAYLKQTKNDFSSVKELAAKLAAAMVRVSANAIALPRETLEVNG